MTAESNQTRVRVPFRRHSRRFLAGPNGATRGGLNGQLGRRARHYTDTHGGPPAAEQVNAERPIQHSPNYRPLVRRARSNRR